eukprot:932506_1
MSLQLLIITYILSCAQFAISIKFTTWNTHQIFTNPFASTTLPLQIDQIIASDSDVLCLQDLFDIKKQNQYLSALKSKGYTHSFSAIDIYTDVAPENLQLPRTPCDETQINALNSTCMRQKCLPIFTQSTTAYAECAATACPDDYAQVIHTECSWCIGSLPVLDSSFNNFELAAVICQNPPPPLNNVLFNFTAGNAIVTKTEYPIINTWSINLPSWILIPQTLLIAEINICAETNPNNIANCMDSIIIGCTLLDPQDFVDDSAIVQSPLLDNDAITSRNGLNRYQSQTVVNKIFNDNILSILGIKEKEDDIFGVMLAGDINNGQIFSRCKWMNEQGQVDADNCDMIPSNAFDVWELAGFIDAIDVAGEDVLCTWCADMTKSDFNDWVPFDYIGTPGLIPFLSHDIDKILIQDGYCENYKNIIFQREFTEKIANLSQISQDGLIPTSNHYGVSVSIEFVDNEGGRDDDKNCKELGKGDDDDDDDDDDDESFSDDSIENAMHMYVDEDSFSSGGNETIIKVTFDSSLLILFLCVILAVCVYCVFAIY